MDKKVFEVFFLDNHNIVFTYIIECESASNAYMGVFFGNVDTENTGVPVVKWEEEYNDSWPNGRKYLVCCDGEVVLEKYCNQEPEEIEWPGRGIAKRVQPKGMSDYQRGNGNANYLTECGAVLRFRASGRWQAQYKSNTTKWYSSSMDAFAALREMEKKNK
jgi:hypothetical protein